MDWASFWAIKKSSGHPANPCHNTCGLMFPERVQTRRPRPAKHDRESKILFFGQVAEPGLPDFSWYTLPKPEKCTK
jgi:hypothetical protein